MLISKAIKRPLILVLSFLLFLAAFSQSAAFARQDEPVQRKGPGSYHAGQKIDASVKEAFTKEPFVTYLVVLKEKPDIHQLSKQAADPSIMKHKTPHESKMTVRNVVMNALKDAAEESQADMIAYLDKQLASGAVREYQSFFIVNVLAVTSNEAVMNKLAAYDEVKAIQPNRTHRLAYEQGNEEEPALQQSEASTGGKSTGIPWNLQNISVPQVWDMGYTGAGIVVANLDSGVDYTHPALKAKWRGFAGGAMSENPELHWYDATYDGKTLPYDKDGHGTHVMGTMVGSEPDGSNRIGVAPDAQWIAVRIFDSNDEATDRGILDAGEWILAPRSANGELHPELAPDIVNNSWSSGSGKNEFFLEIVDAWRAANILPVFSAGNVSLTNKGGPGSVSAPGNYTSSFTVGALDRHKQLASFSLLGPSPYGKTKPDVSAPGVNIRSSLPDGKYGLLSGTSMASPHVAGLAALILQANSSLTVDQLEEIIASTSEPLVDKQFPQSPNNGYGRGQVNVFQAVSSFVWSGLGTIEGQVTTEGSHTVKPVISHETVPLLFNAADQTITAKVSGKTGIERVVLQYCGLGQEEWSTVPMQLTAGDRLDGTYEAEIPAAKLTVPGIQYSIEAEDVTGNTAALPIVEAEVSEGMKLGYKQDFETDIKGFEFGGDSGVWQWGKPLSGPNGAFSGENVIGTYLDGDYPQGTESLMVLPVIDLRDKQHTILSYKHWYELGSWMSAVDDTAEVWIGVMPKNSTSTSDIQYDLAKLYKYKSREWLSDFIDLSPYRGERIFVIFNLRGNNGTGKGWYVDDIELIKPDEEVPPAPQNVGTRSTAPGQIIVSWDKVEGESIKEYAVYRSSTGEEGTFKKLGVTPSSQVYYTGSYIDDPEVKKGTYYYYVKAVTYSLQESAPSQKLSWTFTGGTEIFSEDFEGEDIKGWTAEGENNDWQWGAPSFNYSKGPKKLIAGEKVWGTNLNGDMNRDGERSLISPEIDLTKAKKAVIYYQNWFQIDDYDRLYVDISKDGGENWTALYSLTNKYDNRRPQQWWFLEEVKIKDEFIGHKVNIRFRVASKNSLYSAGWYIDDFEIRETDPVKSQLEREGPADEGRAARHTADVAEDGVLAAGQSADVAENGVLAAGQSAGAADNVLTAEDAPSLRYVDRNYAIGLTAGSGPDAPADAAAMPGLPANAVLTVKETGQSTRTEQGTGRYMLRHPEGDYQLIVESYGFRPYTVPVQVKRGSAARVDVRLEPLKKGRIVGVAADASGNPVAGASIKLLNDPQVPYVLTDEAGKFELEAYEGSYELSAAAKGFQPLTAQVVVQGGKSTPQSLVLASLKGTEQELAYDEGYDDNAVAYNTGGNLYGVKMTAGQPVQVTGAKFYFSTGGWPNPGGTEFEYALFADNEPDGVAGQMIAGPYKGTAKTDGTWTEVKFPHPVILSGDFYIAYIQSGNFPYVPGLAVDETSPGAGRSFKFSNEMWKKPDTNGNFLIRGLVTAIEDQEEEDEVKSIRVTPSSIAIKQGETVPLTVTAEIYGYDASGTKRETRYETVTEQAKYISVNDKVAVADEKGQVTATGEGQGIVIVHYDKHRQEIPVVVSPIDPLEDNEAPKWAEGSKLTVSRITQTGLALSWPPAFDETGVTGYRITVDGKIYVAVAGNTRQSDITGLQPGTSYMLVVKAYDAAGNESKALVTRAATLEREPEESGWSGGGWILLSGNADLKELALRAGGKTLALSPDFAADQHTYRADTEEEQAELTARPAHAGAQAMLKDQAVGEGLKLELKPGENVFELVVHAENGTKKAYQLTITRRSAANEQEKPEEEDREPGHGRIDYIDVAGHWAEARIKRASALGMVKGFTDGSFKPDKPVTRAEFAVMISKTLGLQGKGSRLVFTDLNDLGAWSRQAVAQAVEAGVITGFSDGSFRPNLKITRAEMAAMLARGFKLAADAPTSGSFADKDAIAKWAKGAVDAMHHYGIMNGRGGNRFFPNAEATRAEAVVVLMRALEIGQRP